MAENKSSISKTDSYVQIGEHWDDHELSDVWEQTTEAKFDVDLQSDVFYYAVENSLSSKLRSLAEKRGVSAETLVNLWLQERIERESAAK